MTTEFQLLLRYKQLARQIAELEQKILTLFAHPDYPDAELLEWRERYRELRALNHRVRQSLMKKGVRL
ncbi:hypothetical protein FJY94_08135 [Candidatus Kaiserbacteria bacterium]|nr:hypothetical protein [Candidatus Kaiserbacteria bacterium]